MAKKPEPPSNPIRWDVYRAAARGKLLGTVEAADVDAAVEAAAKEFKTDAWRPLAVQQR
jgi:acyl-CoA reductase-like NAD-dependent aldehyde dehydrogenase